MVYIRKVNRNAEIRELCVLGYKRVMVLHYLVAPVEKQLVWESKINDSHWFSPCICLPSLFHPALALGSLKPMVHTYYV